MAYRARKYQHVVTLESEPKRLGYADPPYPGTSLKYYRDEPSYAGEVDHEELVAKLSRNYDGWALSTSRGALRHILSLCPDNAEFFPWVKPCNKRKSSGPVGRVEYVIVVAARRRSLLIPDALVALPARGGGKLMGRKPLKFCMWLFGLLAASPGDELDDLFPGSGMVGRAWGEFQRNCRQNSSGLIVPNSAPSRPLPHVG